MRKVNLYIKSLILEDIAVQIFNLNRGLSDVAESLLFRETLSGESLIGHNLKFIAGMID